MSKPIILTDIDDVCLDWLGGFIYYAEHMLGRKLEGRPDTWDLDAWLGVAKGEGDKMVHNFNHDAWEFGCLPAIAFAEMLLPRFVEKGIKIIGITSCSTSQQCQFLRKANLFHSIGKDIFSEVHFLPLKTTKRGVLAQFKDEDVIAWVEDKAESAMDGKDFGYQNFLVRRAHNRDFEAKNPDALLYVDDWRDISKMLNV